MPITLPSIAGGDLREASLPEVVAAIFQSRATGTLSVEVSGHAGRVFFRYGVPCGARMPPEVGFKSLGTVLLETGWIDAAQSDQSLLDVASSGKRQGDVLVQMGAISSQQLGQALRLQHHRNLVALMLFDEGKYEFRGYERPPSWTEGISLDPCRAVVDALVEPLSERRVARILSVLEGLGGRARLSPHFPDLAGRFELDAAERKAVAVLSQPLGPDGFASAAAISTQRARALMAALLLLGAAEPDEPESAPVRSGVEDVFASETPSEALPEAQLVDADSGPIAARRAAAAAAARVPEAASSELEEPPDMAAEADIVPEPAAPAPPPEPITERGPGSAAHDRVPQRHAAPAPRPAPAGPPREMLHTDGDRAAVRARLLARAFKNVGQLGERMSNASEGRAPETGPAASPTAPAPHASPASSSIPVEPLGPRTGTGVLTEEQRRFADEIRARAKVVAKEDYFTRLELAAGASIAQVKDAFIRLAKIYHPDRIAGTALENLVGEKVKEVFGAISEAYEVLSDDRRREEYARNKGATQADKQRADEAKIAFQRGEVYAKKRAWSDAEREYRRAVDLDSRPAYWAGLAWVNLMDTSRGPAGQKKAAEHIEAALAIKENPSDRAYYVAGVLARMEEDLAKAEKMFRKCLDLNPAHIEANREVRLVEKRREKEDSGKKQSLFNRPKGR